MKMTSEKIVLDRDRVNCIIGELAIMMKNQNYHEFELQLTIGPHGGQELTITPFAEPVAIALKK